MSCRDALRAAIESRCASVPGRALRRAAEALSGEYRAHAAPDLSEADLRAAYLATRLPATFASLAAAIRLSVPHAPDLRPASLLDLGCGPGAAAWAAADAFDSLESITGIDASEGMLGEARALAATAPHAVLRGARWMRADLESAPDLPAADLVVLSYMLNEAPRAAQSIARRAARAARQALLVVEPGTPAGFERLLDARAAALAEGMRLAAPCPGDGPCPMASGPGWCHFAQRLDRSRTHRLAKGAALGHEDEKSCWILAVRGRAEPSPRITRPPSAHKAAVDMEVCAPGGLAPLSVPRRDREAYKEAKKAAWGDAWPPGGAGR